MTNDEDKKRNPDEEAQLDAFLDLILEMSITRVEEENRKKNKDDSD